MKPRKIETRGTSLHDACAISNTGRYPTAPKSHRRPRRGQCEAFRGRARPSKARAARPRAKTKQIPLGVFLLARDYLCPKNTAGQILRPLENFPFMNYCTETRTKRSPTNHDKNRPPSGII